MTLQSQLRQAGKRFVNAFLRQTTAGGRLPVGDDALTLAGDIYSMADIFKTGDKGLIAEYGDMSGWKVRITAKLRVLRQHRSAGRGDQNTDEVIKALQRLQNNL